ncbi:hypothetical protein JHK87_043448 [Glycine soja]|nr:hypothetical protein JHK87_043448 [Glycine soja]
MRILQALQTNLDGKSKQFEEKDLYGDDWIQQHRKIVQQHANQYKRNVWAEVVSY